MENFEWSITLFCDSIVIFRCLSPAYTGQTPRVSVPTSLDVPIGVNFLYFEYRLGRYFRLHNFLNGFLENPVIY